jgi:hypothetical protein
MQKTENLLKAIPEDSNDIKPSSGNVYLSPVINCRNGKPGRICSSIVDKNLSNEEISELERERQELLLLTPVPGFELVTRKTFLKLKEIKRKS